MSHDRESADFGSPMWIYEENFRLLCRLFPGLESGESTHVLKGNVEGTLLRLELLESSKYTITVMLRHVFQHSGGLLQDIEMRLRIYFDARVAGVLSYQGCEHLPAPYEIKTAGPYTRDERRQTNWLLRELLIKCLDNKHQLQYAVG